MKKVLALILSAALLCTLVLSGCASKGENGGDTAVEGDLLARIQAKGEITIAMEGTWSPWTYHDENDDLVGYDVEVGQAIADYLGVKANFVEGEWDGILAGVESGRYDIMVNGFTVNDERREKYNLTDAYAYDRTAVVVQSDNDEIQSLADLDGKSTANTISSTYAKIAEENGAEVTGVDDLNQTFELLLSGRIDATLNSELTFNDYMKEHPDANIKIAFMTEDANETAIPMKKDADTESLRDEINKAIEELRSSGKLAEISEKYFGTDISTLN